MAEYFESQSSAEDYLRRTQQWVALYARIQLHGSEKWIVDHQDRPRGSLIRVVEDLTHSVQDVRVKSP